MPLRPNAFASLVAASSALAFALVLAGAPSTASAAPKKTPGKGGSDGSGQVVPTEAAATTAPKKAAPKKDEKDEPEGVTENASDGTPGAKPGEKPEEPREERETPWAGRHRSTLLFTGQFGASYLNAAQFASSDLALDRPDGVGPALSFGVGYRFGLLRFGARFVDHEGPRLTVWGFQGDVSIGLSRSRWEPWVGGHLGYSWAHRVDDRVLRSQLPPGTVIPPDVSLGGVNVGGDIGMDYHWQTWLSLGVTGALDALVLSRARADFPETLVAVPASERDRPLYSTAGASLGLAVTAALRATVLFDL